MQPKKCRWKGRDDFWKVDISAKKNESGKRIRQYFPNKAEADQFIIRCNHVGVRDAVGERDKIIPQNYPADLIGRESDKPTVKACVKAFLDTKTAVGKEMASQYRYVLAKNLCKTFGATPIDLITHRELDAWLKKIPGEAMNEYRHYSLGKQFFQWCLDWQEVIIRNPFVKITREKPEAKKDILEVGVMEQAIEIGCALDDADIIAFLALGGFQGMRSIEILRARWEHIDWDAGEICVANPKKTRSGARPRWIKLTPAARAFLWPVRKKSGKIVSRNRKNFYIAFSRLWEGSPDLPRHIDPLSFEAWPNNCLRHSFGTYHLAAFKDGPLTSHEMGHTDAETKYSHYTKAMRQKTALEWWKIHLHERFDEWMWRAFWNEYQNAKKIVPLTLAA